MVMFRESKKQINQKYNKYKKRVRFLKPFKNKILSINSAAIADSELLDLLFNI